MEQPDVDRLRELLTLDELTNRVGMSVRNVRFYTAKGLVPPPIRRGRSGYYTPDHVSRLELVRELQGHGFTLAAIERYLETLPEDASPEDVALHRAMLAPWESESLVEMTTAELEQRAGRTLSGDDLDMLEALGILRPGPRGKHLVALTHLSIGIGLVDLGFPREAAQAAAQVFLTHGRAVAHELSELFRTQVWPVYRDSGASPDRIREVIERLKPLTIASLVSAYETAMDEERRQRAGRRRNGDPRDRLRGDAPTAPDPEQTSGVSPA